MDLKFLAGHLLAKTEIGKNLSVLPARLNKLLQVSDSVTIENLLNFQENTVTNLYSYDADSQIFKFEHKDNEYVAKANGSLDIQRVDFTVEYIEELITEYGISYVGAISIIYEDKTFSIKVPGELSYDPASKSGEKIWVDNYQVSKLVVFVCVLVKAALLGANSKFLRRLYIVMKPIIKKYYQKPELFKWMYSQVRYACMKKKNPPNYVKFLTQLNEQSENIKDFLINCDLLKEGQIQEILPPQEYFKGIEEQGFVGKNKEKIDSSEDHKGRLSQIDDFPMCFSPDFDEDSMPSIKEILDDLYAVREKYEIGVANAFENLGKTEEGKKVLSEMFTVEKSFKAQCPIF